MANSQSKIISEGCGIFCHESSELDYLVVEFMDVNESRNKKNQVVIEGYCKEAAAEAEDDNLMRTKSLTEGDLDDLKGCVDLGFGFSYEDIPALCNTLPALELCYSMNQTILNDRQRLSESPPPQAGLVTNWKISSPGDNPEEVKARLKYWAKAVACTVGLCS